MDPSTRIEQALNQAISQAEVRACPPRLAQALRYAVFPGGARIRPRLCLAVAAACAEDTPALTDAAAAAIEFMHCASLVHDDLPCFDDAPTRRGKASVHRAFDERLAVLCGDALIVMAFDTLSRQGARHPERLVTLLNTVSRSVGAPSGICAGQAWECEPRVSLAEYQRAKTGALFAAATVAGAAAAGVEAEPWRALGEGLGEAFQVADDLHDAAGEAEELGKPTGRDAALGRPSAVGEFGVAGATERLKRLLEAAVASIPDCPGAVGLRALVLEEAEQFLPRSLRQRAA